MKNLSSAEQKTQTRQAKSVFGSGIVAVIILLTAFISSNFTFDTLATKIVMAAAIIASWLFVLIFLVRYFKKMDEYERKQNADAAMVALFSSMLLLPWSYLHKIGLLPELNFYYGFMFMWLVYVFTFLYRSFKQ